LSWFWWRWYQQHIFRLTSICVNLRIITPRMKPSSSFPTLLLLFLPLVRLMTCHSQIASRFIFHVPRQNISLCTNDISPRSNNLVSCYTWHVSMITSVIFSFAQTFSFAPCAALLLKLLAYDVQIHPDPHFYLFPKKLSYFCTSCLVISELLSVFLSRFHNFRLLPNY
jgi:hypothetical protein